MPDGISRFIIQSVQEMRSISEDLLLLFLKKRSRILKGRALKRVREGRALSQCEALNKSLYNVTMRFSNIDVLPARTTLTAILPSIPVTSGSLSSSMLLTKLWSSAT